MRGGACGNMCGDVGRQADVVGGVGGGGLACVGRGAVLVLLDRQALDGFHMNMYIHAQQLSWQESKERDGCGRLPLVGLMLYFPTSRPLSRMYSM